MSRLIDADLLIKDFEEEVMKCDFDKLSDNDKLIIETSARALVGFAKRQPTAYNVDAVVEALEEEREEILNSNDYESEIINYCLDSFDRAIEIVEAGGKNDI